MTLKLSLFFILFAVSGSTIALDVSCKEERITGVEHTIPDSTYLTKIDNKADPINTAFGKRKPLLYCSKLPSQDKCEVEVWYTLEQFIKIQSLFKTVTCYYKYNHISVIKGVKTSEEGIVYFTEK
jgi:hypothetical protein